MKKERILSVSFVDSLSSIAFRKPLSLRVDLLLTWYMMVTWIHKLPTMKLSRGISVLTCTDASRGRTMGRFALPAPEFVAAVSPAHPAREIHFDAAFFAHPTGEFNFSRTAAIDSSALREVTSSGTPSLEVLTSKFCSSSTISSCNAPLNPRT